MSPHLTLVCRPKIWTTDTQQGKHYSVDLDLHVVDAKRTVVPEFEMMCEAIDSDIQSAEGSGATALEEIRRIESGEAERIESDGNAWVTYITRDKVWFEGLYGQGEGGEVSFAQYKLAVQTYVRFLADPQHKPIEVDFPDR
ncbi:hypothetical protein [Caldimonas sp.]|uniref:hypothetical protein n=1 Tax=Caldimonas sp. TaxID=2838790 RepID=UPI0039194201